MYHPPRRAKPLNDDLRFLRAFTRPAWIPRRPTDPLGTPYNLIKIASYKGLQECFATAACDDNIWSLIFKVLVGLLAAAGCQLEVLGGRERERGEG